MYICIVYANIYDIALRDIPVNNINTTKDVKKNETIETTFI